MRKRSGETAWGFITVSLLGKAKINEHRLHVGVVLVEVGTPTRRFSVRTFSTWRAVRSLLPPGAEPTTISTLRWGVQVCAFALAVARRNAQTSDKLKSRLPGAVYRRVTSDRLLVILPSSAFRLSTSAMPPCAGPPAGGR